jgi:hypothetical protein
MSIQDIYSYRASSDSYLIGDHSYQCVCVLHAILLPSGYLTLSTIAPYKYVSHLLVYKYYMVENSLEDCEYRQYY